MAGRLLIIGVSLIVALSVFLKEVIYKPAYIPPADMFQFYTRTPAGVPTLYYPKVYSAQFTTNGSGVITDTLTVDGTTTGTALFSTVSGIQLSGKYGGSTISIPMQGYTLSANLKTLTINVGTGTILGILGATVLSAGSGTQISILIIGT